MVIAEISMMAFEMGTTLAQKIGSDPHARSLWVRDVRDVAELWLLTSAIPIEAGIKYYDHSAVLYDTYPGQRFELHIINPTLYHERDLEVLANQLIPAGSRRIAFHDR